MRFPVFALLFLLPTVAASETILFDTFSDGVLDGAWAVQFNEHACGWTYTEFMDLNVTDICHSGSYSQWAGVSLRQPCFLPGDFTAVIRIGWDSHGVTDAMQGVYLEFRDGDENLIVSTGYRDAWELRTGEVYCVTESGAEFHPGYDTMPLSGAAAFEIRREGANLTVTWDDSTVIQTTQPDTLTTLDILFHNTWWTGYTRVIDLTVEYVQVDVPTTSVPTGPPARVARLLGNRPNPFNPKTEVRIHLPEAGAATLAVYDPSGRLVATLLDGTLPAGDHGFSWDGRDRRGRETPSGVYFARLDAGKHVDVRKIALLR